jgi:hypothetical protein
MKKLNLRYLRKWYVLVLLAIIFIGTLAFVGRGWVRETAVPDVLSLPYGRQVKRTLDQQYKNLNQPLSYLGLGTPSSKNKCGTVYASHFQTDVDCSSIYSAYSDKVSALSPDLGVRAAKLDLLLKAQGWQGGNTYLTTLGQNIAKGIDWTPDAAYNKTVGKVTCQADFNTAFSKPKPPAMYGEISCFRDIELFGPNCGPIPNNSSLAENLKWQKCFQHLK